MARPASVAGTVVLLLLGGCSDAEDSPGASPAPGPSGPSSSAAPMLQPGAPGEDASTIGPDDLAEDPGHSEADVTFAQMMIPHHAQALEMVELVPGRSRLPALAVLADRIQAAQGPEIRELGAWLDSVGADVPRAEDAHGDHAMAGMLTPAELAALRRAEGTRFDRLFLTGMIRHHQGAIQMVDDLAGAGLDVRIQELAADVVATQSAEIRTMRRLLTQL